MKKFFNTITAVLIIAFFSAQAFCATNQEIREQAKILYLGKEFSTAKERILQIPPSERIAADYFLIGNTEKDLKPAITAYEEAIKLDNDFYQAYYNIGSRYFDAQNYEKAIFYFKLAVNRNKKFEYGYYNLGCAYLKTEQYNQARKSFESAIKLNPQEADYYYNLAYAYKKTENLKRAEKALGLYNELVKKRNET